MKILLCDFNATHQNAGQNHKIKTANRSFENATRLKYFGMTITNQNLIHEEIQG
jgi:hypothetical protein